MLAQQTREICWPQLDYKIGKKENIELKVTKAKNTKDDQGEENEKWRRRNKKGGKAEKRIKRRRKRRHYKAILKSKDKGRIERMQQKKEEEVRKEAKWNKQQGTGSKKKVNLNVGKKLKKKKEEKKDLRKQKGKGGKYTIMLWIFKWKMKTVMKE